MTISAPPSGDFVMPTMELPPAPPESRDPERRGASRTQITAVCCPSCGSVHVLRRSSRVGQPFAWWRCQEDGCGYMWKEPFMVGRSNRASIASL
jgi:ribosomal protein L37AE/L43A